MKNTRRVRVRRLEGTPYLISEDEKVGETASASVFLAYNLQIPNQQLAAKIVNLQNPQHAQALTLALQNISQQLSHQNVVQYSAAQTLTETTSCIVMEYCNGGSLYLRLADMKLMPEDKIWGFLQQFCLGYRALFDQKIVHLGIRPHNILIHDGNYKISDAGLFDHARLPAIAQTQLASQQLLYLPPEIEQEAFSAKVDVFSLGCVLYQLAYDALHPFQAHHKQTPILKEYFQKVRKGKLVCGEKNKKGETRSASLRELLQGMLEIQPQKRLAWEQIFENKNIGINYHEPKATHKPTEKESEIDQLRQTLVHVNRSSILIADDPLDSPSNDFVAIEEVLGKEEVKYLQVVTVRLKVILLSMLHCNRKIDALIRDNARHRKLQPHVIEAIKKVAVEGLLYLLRNTDIVLSRLQEFNELPTREIKAALEGDRLRVLEEYRRELKVFRHVDEETFLQAVKTYDLRSFEHCLHTLLTVYSDYPREAKEALRPTIAVLVDVYDAALRLTEMTQKEKISWRGAEYEEIETAMDEICLSPHPQDLQHYLGRRELASEKDVTAALRRVGLLFE